VNKPLQSPTWDGPEQAAWLLPVYSITVLYGLVQPQFSGCCADGCIPCVHSQIYKGVAWLLTKMCCCCWPQQQQEQRQQQQQQQQQQRVQGPGDRPDLKQPLLQGVSDGEEHAGGAASSSNTAAAPAAATQRDKRHAP
jgi:hypothetical protein